MQFIADCSSVSWRTEHQGGMGLSTEAETLSAVRDAFSGLNRFSGSAAANETGIGLLLSLSHSGAFAEAAGKAVCDSLTAVVAAMARFPDNPVMICCACWTLKQAVHAAEGEPRLRQIAASGAVAAAMAALRAHPADEDIQEGALTTLNLIAPLAP